MPQTTITPLTVLLMVLAFAAATPVLAAEPQKDGQQADPTQQIDSQTPITNQDGKIETELADPEKQLPLDDLRKFTEVFERIKRGYVEDISDRKLLNKAIKGMLSGLDPHSAYLEPDAFSQLQESTSGEFGGLGIEVGMEDGFVRVIAPIDGTPAKKAGVQAGDMIVEIDGTPVKGMSLEEAVKEMRGEPGTTINLTISREGESGPVKVTIERAIIEVDSVKSRMLEDDYGYIRISQFQEKTGDQFVSAYEELVGKNAGDLKGLVLDLRNNPGGVLEAAVSVADSLLHGGRIVYTEGRIESSQLSFDASDGDIAEDVPIVVLINSGSASASEILAGALQDHRRAVIMGTDSFGKGSVQTVMPLGDNYGIKLTTARYYTPDGRSIQAKGIEPDIEVKAARIKDVQDGRRFTEADLPGHLDNGQQDKSQQDSQADSDDESEAEQEEEAARRDYQLRSALNMLKGMSIMHVRDRQQPARDKDKEEDEASGNSD